MLKRFRLVMVLEVDQDTVPESLVGYPRAYGWRGGYYGGWRGGAVAWRRGWYR